MEHNKTEFYSNKLKRKKQLADRGKKNYINNDSFLVEIIAYKKLIDKNKSKTKIVRMPETLALMFYKLADNISSKGNFINYPFKEDMVADAIENCVQCAHKFDTNKYDNPFSYFTQVIFYAFVRRIKKEKKQVYAKYKSFLCSELSDNEEIMNLMKSNDNLKEYKEEFVRCYEESMEKKKPASKKKKKEKSLEFFFEVINTIEE